MEKAKAFSPQVLAEMCQSGYKDALRFLEENSECCTHHTSPASLFSSANCVTDDMFCGARPGVAGAPNRRPRPAGSPAPLLPRAHRNHQRVVAPEAPPTAQAALVAGWADSSAYTHQERWVWHQTVWKRRYQILVKVKGYWFCNVSLNVLITL